MAGVSPPPDQPGAVESYPTESDAPTDLDPGTLVYIEDEQTLYYETGN